MNSQVEVIAFPANVWEDQGSQHNPEERCDDQVQAVGALCRDLSNPCPLTLRHEGGFGHRDDTECGYDEAPVSQIIIKVYQLVCANTGCHDQE